MPLSFSVGVNLYYDVKFFTLIGCPVAAFITIEFWI